MDDKINSSSGGGPGQVPGTAAGSPTTATILGDFELRQVIGRGGMGTVYEAWQRSLARTVALKVLAGHIASSEKAIERFRREARAAAKLHHMHVVPIFAQGEQDGVYFYAMELIHGRGLNAVIAEAREKTDGGGDLGETVPLPRARRHGGLADAGTDTTTPFAVGSSTTVITLAKTTVAVGSNEYFAEVARHIASAADALDYAHGEGVIHRDVKPHNLILGDDGRLRIADFGLARVVEQPGVTVTGEMVGSPLYMSPEQITAGPGKVDHRTDIYSLGATMYEWLTLRLPYPGETREAVIGRILSSEPLPLRSHNPDIPADLETICLRAIDREPTQRYRTAGELRNDLQRFLDHRPIHASPAGLFMRTRKFVARHQLTTLACAAVIVAAALTWALYRQQGQVRQHAAVVDATIEQLVAEKETTDHMLDLFLRSTIPMADLAVEGVTHAGETVSSLAEDIAAGPGAHVEAVTTPEGIARRVTRDLYEQLTPIALPRDDPNNAFAVVLQSAQEQRDDNPDRALQLVSAYLEQQPDDALALQLRVSLYGQRKEYEKMAEDAERLVLLRGDDPVVHLWRATARLLLNEIEPCLQDLSHAAAYDPTAAWAQALRGLVLLQMGRPGEALAVLNGALALSPDLTIAVLGRASALKSTGDVAAAVTSLTRVIEMEPKNADALAARGEHHATMGNFDDAIRDFDRAMALAGPTQAMVFRYVTAVFQQRQLQQAGGQTEADQEAEPLEPPSDEASKERVQEWLNRFHFPRTPSKGG